MSKTILITGASTGIGAETARHLAPGNTILVHYHSSKDEAEQVATDVRDRGGEAHLLQANLAMQEGCARLVEMLTTQFDRLDVLVNNAGGLVKRHTVDELEWSLMERIFALNVYSAMFLSSRCLPLLKQGIDPCIINLVSIAVRTGAPTATLYGAAKAAIDAFTRGAARELAPNIRVNGVAPGVILTPFHERYSTPERLESFRESTPLKRNGEPVHVASAIQLLVENNFITGETIDVNGGLFMR